LKFPKYLELRGDNFRDLKNESTTLKFEKQNCNLLHLSKLAHSLQNNFQFFARGSPVDAKKKYLGLLE